jgi:hypothetical protein
MPTKQIKLAYVNQLFDHTIPPVQQALIAILTYQISRPSLINRCGGSSKDYGWCAGITKENGASLVQYSKILAN